MNESAPYIPPDEMVELSKDTEKKRSQRAEVIAKMIRKIRRVEQGLETEVDETTRQFKTSLKFMGFTLGSSAIADDEED